MRVHQMRAMTLSTTPVRTMQASMTLVISMQVSTMVGVLMQVNSTRAPRMRVSQMRVKQMLATSRSSPTRATSTTREQQMRAPLHKRVLLGRQVHSDRFP
jgi:hypothetical protein